MTNVNQLITEHLDIWSAATERKSSAGRGNGSAVSLFGIKKLRELILELAVRGKLVPQEESEGTAQQLLCHLDRGKTELISSGQIKKPRKVDHRPAPERHPLPSDWLWVHLDEIGAVVGGGTPKASDPASFENSGDGFPWLTPADLSGYSQIHIERGARDLSKKGLSKSSATPMPPNTVLFTSRAPIGYVAISAGSITTNQGFKSVVPFSSEMARYIALVLRCFAPEIDAAAPGTTFKEVSGKIVAGLSFPLPPLAEQHRIVAKVDELMALCDALERQSEDSLKAHQTLVETCLATLTNSKSAEELSQNWARIETHFDTLFTTEGSVTQLKEVVLQLGVRGKLLPQSPDDEAADILLQGLLKGRSKINKRRRGAVGESTMTAPPFLLPENWIWHRFGDLVEFQSELVKPDGYQDLFQVAPDVIEKGTGRLTDQRTVKESGIRGPNNRFYSGQILYSKIRPSLSKAVIAPYDGLCSADMYPLKALINPDYLLLSILSEDFLAQVRRLENRIKMPKLNVGSLSSIHIAVPPLDEQSRIVEKIKSMFRLCDLLSVGIEKSQKYSVVIADTLTSKIH